MNDFLLRLLGVPAGEIPDEAVKELTWANMPQSWGAFVLVGGVLIGLAGVFYLYRREMASCPKPVRLVLAALRSAVLLLLVLAALGPAISYTVWHRIDPMIVVALDTSRSMSQTDRYLDDAAVAPVAAALQSSPEAVRGSRPSPIELVERIAQQDNDQFVRTLATQGRLRLIHFADQATVLETKPRFVPDEKPAEVAQSVERTLAWPELRWTFWVSAFAVAVLAVVALVRGSALLALIGAVPLTVAFFSATLLIEENAHLRPLVALGLEPVDDMLFGAPSEQPKPEAPVEPPKPFDASLALRDEAGEFVARGAATDLARAIRTALEATATGPVSAIIVVSDGRHNVGGDDHLKAADAAADRNVPIYTVGVGDSSAERRIDLVGVHAEDRVWRNDPFPIQASIKAKGYEGRTISVALYERRADEPQVEGRLLERRDNIRLSSDSAEETITFEHTPEREGEFQYVVRIENLPDADIEGRREEFAPVIVLRDKARVLLVAGSPTWDYRFLQVLLTRDHTIDLSCWLQSIQDMPQEGNTRIEQLPLTRQELSVYDVVLLLDPNPSEFTVPADGGLVRWSEIIKEFVDDGGGLLYMPGPKYAGNFLTDRLTAGVTEVLPVRFGETAALLSEHLTARFAQPYRLRPVPSNIDHAIMKFETQREANTTRWERMPPMYWSFPARAAKSGFPTLLEHSDPQLATSDGNRPLLVTGQYGAGRTVYMGFNGSWRWRRLGKDGEYYSRFWIQTVRYLIEGRLLGSQKRGFVEIAGGRFPVGSKVPVRVRRVRDDRGEPLTEPTLVAAVQMYGEKTPVAKFPLNAVPDQPGMYEGEIEVRRQGYTFVAIELPGARSGETVTLTSKNFLVELSDVELETRQLNRPLLQEIAQRSSGQYEGKYFELNELDKLVAAVPDQKIEKPVPGRPVTLWDTSRLLFVLALLLTIEWGTRKRWKLL